MSARAIAQRPSATHQAKPGATNRAALMLGVGVALLAGLAAINLFVAPGFAGSLPERAQDGLTLALSVLIEALPWVVLGVTLSIAVQIWLPSGVLEKFMPRKAWARRMVLSLLGIVVPVCECGNVPFARGLMMRGFSPADTLTFLVAAPIVNPIVIITTHAAFGWSGGILSARIIGGFAVANLIGWIFSRHPNPDALLTEKFHAACDMAVRDHAPKAQRTIVQFMVEMRAVMPALILGSALAGAVQVLIAREALIAIGSNPVLSIAVMMALAIIVAICSNVDSFFALSFASTFSSGSIIAFLIVGPIVDIKMLALMRTTFTTRTLAVIVAVVVLFAFVLGLGVNLFV